MQTAIGFETRGAAAADDKAMHVAFLAGCSAGPNGQCAGMMSIGLFYRTAVAIADGAFRPEDAVGLYPPPLACGILALADEICRRRRRSHWRGALRRVKAAIRALWSGLRSLIKRTIEPYHEDDEES